MRGSLYDSYRLSNSTAIPMFEGSGRPEAVQVGQYLQGQYDTARTGADIISTNASNIPAMPGSDTQLATDLRNEVNARIDQYSSAKDWENHVEDVQNLGRHYMARATELAAPVKAYQDWQTNMLEDKTRNYNSTQKEILKARYLYNYNTRGALRKEASGRYSGSFAGMEIGKNLDPTEKVDKWLKDRVVQEGGSEISRDPDGMWKYKIGNEWKRFTPERVKQIIADGMALDPDWKDYLKLEKENAGFVNSHGVRSIMDVAKEHRPAVQAYMNQGATASEAVDRAAQDITENHITSTAMNYGLGKYEQNDLKTVNDQGMSSAALKRLEKQTDDFRLAGAGANTIPSWANDPEKLTKEITDSKDQILDLSNKKAIQERLLKADPNNTSLATGLDRINKQIEQNQKVLDNNQAVWDHTRDQSVQDLKIDDGKGGIVATYKQYLESAKQRLTPQVAKIARELTATNGKKYTAEQIAEAALAGNLKSTYSSGTGGGGSSLGVGDNGSWNYELKMPDGAVIKGTQGDNKLGKVVPTLDNANQVGQGIDKHAHAIHKTVSEGYSVAPNAVGLDQTEQRVIGDFGISSATVYKAPGSNQIYSDKDIRSQKFVPEKFNVETNRITGRFRDSKGVLTEPMDVEMNTNMKSELRSRLAKNNTDGKWGPIIASMDDASYSGPLTRVKPGAVLTGVPDANGLPTSKPLLWNGKKMHLVNDAQGVDREWVLTDEQGNPIIDKNGDQYRTPNISEADAWLRQMSQPEAPKKKK